VKFAFAQYMALLPILVVSATIVFVMLAIAIRRNHWWNATFSVVGLNAAFLAALVLYGGPLLLPHVFPQLLPQQITPLLIVDSYGIGYSLLLIATTLATATLLHAYMEGYAGNKEEIYLLLVLSALGAMVLACANHLASFFIGLELMSVPLYAMVAYPHRSKLSLESGVKYLVLSAVASAFLLFGMALIYSQTGALSFAGIAARSAELGLDNIYLLVGGAFILVAVGFKLSVVPFHLWTPDVYEGAPAPVAAFLATASKTAVFAVLLRYFIQARGHDHQALLDVLSVLAIASMLIGNVLALMQNNIKRLLAYSSIAHFGYCLVALIAAGPLAVEAVGVYLITYVVTTMGTFGVVTLVSSPYKGRDADLISDYRGLFWKRPYLASILTAMMLSLAGIPVTAGFIGKFYVIAAGVDARLWWLLGAVVLGSAIGLYYYLRVLMSLFLLEPGMRRSTAPLNWGAQVGGAMVLLLMLLMLGMGLYPQPLLFLVQNAGLGP
jgi:NADH-quinone oxidoreductase subunit N